ncbi:MAG TPA: radical SAM protein [Armatimonadota bacterium]|jgi:radical SAM superfamily enzyme YgiQ (UPF0313 family)
MLKLSDKNKHLLEAETGTITKPHGGRLRVALAFPNSYHLGMSNLGFQMVYRLFNEVPEVVCERAFLPDEEDVRELVRSGAPWRSLESDTPLRDFDVIAFSISFEMDYLNLLTQLELAGQPLRSLDRDNGHPLVLVGGPAVTINPEPIAEFADAFCVGDGEEMVGDLASVMLADSGGQDRDDLLRRLAQVEGVYVPRFYSVDYTPEGLVERIYPTEPGVPFPIRRRIAKDLSRYNVSSTILTPNTEFPNMMMMEVARGCARSCRFCFAGYGFRPVRYRKEEDTEGVKLQCDAMPPDSQWRPRVGLVGSSLSDNPNTEEIASHFADSGFQVSAASVRAETTRQRLTDALAKGGSRSLTLAPEAGTDRLRKVIKKPMKESALQEAVGNAVRSGIRRIKLYFMCGLPTETDEDVLGVADMAKRLWEAHPSTEITLSMNPLVPKPFTPFQWQATEPVKTLQAKQRLLEKALNSYPRVKVDMASPRMMELQALLARGDRRLSGLLVLAKELGGDWRRAARELEVDIDWQVRRERGQSEVFPWEVLSLHLDREYLWQEYQMGLLGVAQAYELTEEQALELGVRRGRRTAMVESGAAR